MNFMFRCWGMQSWRWLTPMVEVPGGRWPTLCNCPSLYTKRAREICTKKKQVPLLSSPKTLMTCFINFYSPSSLLYNMADLVSYPRSSRSRYWDISFDCSLTGIASYLLSTSNRRNEDVSIHASLSLLAKKEWCWWDTGWCKIECKNIKREICPRSNTCW